MGNKSCSLFSFLCAAKGNWRNSVFIECGGCRCGKREPCPGYLMVPDYDGQPVIIPAGAVKNMTGLAADKNECLAAISRRDFEDLYALWLEWNVSAPKECALPQIAGRTGCGCKDREPSCCYQKYLISQCVLNQ